MFLKKKIRKIRILPLPFSIVSEHPQWNPVSRQGDREEQHVGQQSRSNQALWWHSDNMAYKRFWWHPTAWIQVCGNIWGVLRYPAWFHCKQVQVSQESWVTLMSALPVPRAPQSVYQAAGVHCSLFRVSTPKKQICPRMLRFLQPWFP